MKEMMKTAFPAKKLVIYRIVRDVPFPMIGLSLLNHFKPEHDSGPLPLYYVDSLFLAVPVNDESTSADVGKYVKTLADKAMVLDATIKDCLEYGRMPEPIYKSTIHINGGTATSAYLITDSQIMLDGRGMALLVNSLNAIADLKNHRYSITSLGVRIIGEVEDACKTYTEDIKKILNNLSDRAASEKENSLADLPMREFLDFLAGDTYYKDTEEIKRRCQELMEIFG